MYRLRPKTSNFPVMFPYYCKGTVTKPVQGHPYSVTMISGLDKTLKNKKPLGLKTINKSVSQGFYFFSEANIL